MLVCDLPDQGDLIVICEVCGNQSLEHVLDLGKHPLCDDLKPFGDPSVCKEYPVVIDICSDCLTCFQRYQVPKEDLFPRNYHYRARMTPSVLAFMDDFVDSVVTYFGSVQGLSVLDIGCNDGSLLSRFKDRGAITFGVDPTDAAIEAMTAGHSVIQAYFSSEVALQLQQQGLSPDIITFTNVFAHIEDLKGLTEALKILINPKTIVIVENHYLGSIIASAQFDTFYHEHPRTYSARSFAYIAKMLGLSLLGVEFTDRYGGNIRAWMGNEVYASNLIPEKLLHTADESTFLDELRQMQARVDSWKSTTIEFINSLITMHGRLPAKAFPGRAAILIKLLGLDYNQISAVYEIKGSIKVGNYVPGTRIPILPEADLYASGYQGPIINLAWHLSEEVRLNLARNGFTGKVYDIIGY